MTTLGRSRLLIATLLVGCGMIFGYVLPRASFAVRAVSGVAPQVPSGLLPRFIDFDVGVSTISQGATHPNEDLGYIYLPDGAGLQPQTTLHFTMPPDFSSGTNVSVRLLWAGETGSCAMSIGGSLVGRGAQHDYPNTAAYDAYWPGEQTSSTTAIVQAVDAGQSMETVITFHPRDGRPTYPGDAMRLLVYRDSGAALDTCTASLVVQSISVIYQGMTTYAPLIQR